MPELQAQPEPSPSSSPGAAPVTLGYASGLKKMSTTAGAGTQEYVAINPIAVVALLLGVASLLALLYDILLVVPLAGLVCAAVAWRQIRNSNETQSGKALAVAGAAMCVLIGGGILGFKGIRAMAARADEEAIAKLIQQLGQNVRDKKYHDGYQLFTERFHKRIDERTFATRWEELGAAINAGNFRAMEWNGTRLEFEGDSSTGGQIAYGMAIITFDKELNPAPRRNLVFTKVNGKWMIDDFPDVFPTPKKKGQDQGAGPQGPAAGM